ncbi:MAG: hypothetical protein WC054_05500 [Candidatus Nanopelagicales bacterium]
MTVTAEQAKAMLDAATSGPWLARRGTRTDGLFIDGGENPYDEVLPTSVDCGHYCQGGTAVIEATTPDAALIAAAPDLAATVVELWERLATVEAEQDKLARWKAEAMIVLAGWDEVWRVAGCPGALGESTSTATAKHIDALQAAIDKVLAIIAEPFIPSDQIVPGQHWADTNNQRIYKALTQGGEGS